MDRKGYREVFCFGVEVDRVGVAKEKLKFGLSDRERGKMYGSRDCGAANKDRGAETWLNIPEGGGGAALNANCVQGAGSTGYK